MVDKESNARITELLLLANGIFNKGKITETTDTYTKPTIEKANGIFRENQDDPHCNTCQYCKDCASCDNWDDDNTPDPDDNAGDGSSNNTPSSP